MANTATQQLYHIFPHYLINGKILGKKLLNVKCVFSFSLQLSPEKFPILRKTKRDMIKKMDIGLHVMYTLFLSDFY
jgi:hypothetical protein